MINYFKNRKAQKLQEQADSEALKAKREKDKEKETNHFNKWKLYQGKLDYITHHQQLSFSLLKEKGIYLGPPQNININNSRSVIVTEKKIANTIFKIIFFQPGSQWQVRLSFETEDGGIMVQDHSIHSVVMNENLSYLLLDIEQMESITKDLVNKNSQKIQQISLELTHQAKEKEKNEIIEKALQLVSEEKREGLKKMLETLQCEHEKHQLLNLNKAS